MDNRPFKERMIELQQEIAKLCREKRIEIMPVLQPGLQQITAQFLYVDMNDKEQMKKYGLIEKTTDTPSILVN